GRGLYTNRKSYPSPDLFLLDLKMPRVDGFGVLLWMRDSGLEEPPVLVLSGSDLQEDKRRAEDLGARGFYIKSSDFSETAELMERLCEWWLKPVSSVLTH